MNIQYLKIAVVRDSLDQKALSITAFVECDNDTDPVVLMLRLPDFLEEKGHIICLPDDITGADIVRAANEFTSIDDLPKQNTYDYYNIPKGVYAAALSIFSPDNSAKLIFAGIDNVSYNPTVNKWMVTFLAVNPAFMRYFRAR